MRSDAQDLDGKYRLGRILKQGERAMVVAATHLALNDQVVIKVLHAGERDPRLAAKLRRAARQSAALRSEHVVRYLDVGHLVDQRPYVVMERLVGETLSERLARSGPLPVAQAASVILHTCEALACAHVRGIHHRDLRASNLFCTQQPDGRIVVKVLNFGTSRGVDASGMQEDQGMTVAALAVDSPDYKAPEQIVSRSKTDTRTDTWALGVILYEMLTGTRPFDAPTPQETVRRILSAEVPPARQIPPELEKVIRGCISLRREERWDSVARVADAVAPFAGPESASYPARIHQILSTPPPEEPPIDSTRESAPVPVAAMLASPGRGGTLVMASPKTAAPEPNTESGLPRLDDGHTQPRSYPWLQVDKLPAVVLARRAAERRKRITIYGAALAVVALAIALLPKLVLDLRASGQEPAKAALPSGPAETTSPTLIATSPATPATSPAPSVAPQPSATMPSAPSESAPVARVAADVPTSSPRTGALQRAPLSAQPGSARSAASSTPAVGSRTPRPRASTEGGDPWGWER